MTLIPRAGGCWDMMKREAQRIVFFKKSTTCPPIHLPREEVVNQASATVDPNSNLGLLAKALQGEKEAECTWQMYVSLL